MVRGSVMSFRVLGLVRILVLLGCASHEAVAAGDPTLVSMLRKVKARTGWEANGIIDVGANQGEWTREARKLFPASKILMLEATPMHEAALQRVAGEIGSAEYRIAVITGTDGETVQYFQGRNTGNSLFRERSKHYTNDKPVEHVSKTVDTLVRQSLLGNEPVDVIKADVQGAELLVLQGATGVLQQASFVYLEASTIEYNEGAPCFYEVDAFLRSQGYFLYDVALLSYNDAFKTFGLGQYDVMYIRPDSPRLPAAMKDLGSKFCGHNRKQSPCLGSTTSDVVSLLTVSTLPGMEDGTLLPSLLGFVAGFLLSALLVSAFALRTRRLRDQRRPLGSRV